ncbi:MBL fold metallo-hydrolase [Lewinella sp. IMCC34191]|uniref:MBL fold metallo-hydrolase n=1 Tax=Lewinella sp. IMCC34191 TaxID=2259172 RepID=UPI000E279899|nr:MBL fold metallo-hydrolase [Lewinella sp. IMCC34191]
MKITKYLHSCLLLEHDNQRLLFDPGSFSFAHGEVDAMKLTDIDYLVITHNHPDHLFLPAIKQIVANNDLEIIANQEVADKLQGESFEVTVFEEGKRQFGAFHLEAVPVSHEPILSDTMPVVTAFYINDSVLNPGDSFSEDLLRFRGCDVLLCPIMAPFLTEVQAFDFMTKMQPKAVIPVHDGYAKEYFVQARQKNYAAYLEKNGIGFHGLVVAGESVEV